MFMLPQPANTPENDAARSAQDRRDEDAEYYRRVLQNLIDKGADIANRLHQQAMAEPTPIAPTPIALANDEPEPIRGRLPAPGARSVDVTLQFDRIARSIRRTVTLARKLSEPEQPAATQAQHRLAARKRIIRVVEDTIQRKGETPRNAATIAALTAEFYERLDAPDVDDDIDTRPVADVIQDILHDLGVGAFPGTRPFKRRTPADIATLQARAANLPLPRVGEGRGEGASAQDEYPGPAATIPHPSSPGSTRISPRAPPAHVARPPPWARRYTSKSPATWFPRQSPG